MGAQQLSSLTAEQQTMLRRCCQSGTDNPDSEIGCYVLYPENLRDLASFFDPLLRDHHRASLANRHVTDWNLDGNELDLAAFGLPSVSIRVRVARNLSGFDLPGSMTRAERVRLERFVSRSLAALIERPEYGGRIYSLTPEFGSGESNPNLIDHAAYRQLVETHIMFKDMSADRYLKSAGIAADWPYGRACYVSADNGVIVWIGEEDHLRIVCRMIGTKLSDPFNRLRAVLEILEALPGMEFIEDEKYGYVTSCPSNLGTGLRVSVLLALPQLATGGARVEDIRTQCDQVGLAIRGANGEHSPIESGGPAALSLIRRLFVSERDILRNLFDGIQRLKGRS